MNTFPMNNMSIGQMKEISKKMKLMKTIDLVMTNTKMLYRYSVKRLARISRYIKSVMKNYHKIPKEFQIDVTNDKQLIAKQKELSLVIKIKNLFKKNNVKERDLPKTNKTVKLLKLVLPIIKNTNIHPLDIKKIENLKLEKRIKKIEKEYEEEEAQRLEDAENELANIIAQEEEANIIDQEEDLHTLEAEIIEAKNKIEKENRKRELDDAERVEVVYQALINLPSSLPISQRFISSTSAPMEFGKKIGEGVYYLSFGKNIEGRDGLMITLNGETASIKELVDRNTRHLGRRLFTTNGLLGKQRVNTEGEKITQQSIQVTDLGHIVQKEDKYFITNSDGTGEANIPFQPTFNYWTVTQIKPIVGGSYKGTKLKPIKYRMLKKNLNLIGFYPKKGTKKYYLPKNCIAVDSLDNKLNNNCFYHALQFFYPNNKIPIHIDTIRMKLGLINDEPIDSNHISKIEEMLKIDINIFDSNMKIIYGNAKSQYNILLADNHYFAIIINVEKKKKKKKQYKRPLLVFFDFESIVNKSDICMPYSWSLCTMTYKNDLVEKTFNYIGENAMKTFDEKLYGIWKACDERPITLVSFNGDKFDNIIYSEYLLSQPKSFVNVSHDGTAVTNIESKKIKGTIDLYKILTGSLKKNCVDYKLAKEVSKSSFDHSDAQKAYEKGGIKEIEKLYGKILLKYNDLDVLSLRALYKIVVRDVQGIGRSFNLDIPVNIIETKRTVSSLTKYLSNSFGKRNNSKKPGELMLKAPKKESKEERKERNKKSFHLFKKARTSLIGGRSQMFNELPITVQNYGSIDWVSLYPSVMLNNTLDSTTGKLIDHYYPTGQCFECDHLIPITEKVNHPLMKYQMGIYEVRNINQSHLKNNIIPKKTKEGLDWNCDLIESRQLTTIEIAHLEKYNCTFEIGLGIVWETYDNTHMGPYVTKLYKLKQEQDIYKATKDKKYNPSKRQQIKILLNSLFGKNCENIHTGYYQIMHRNKSKEISDEIEIVTIDYVNEKAVVSGRKKDQYFERKWGTLSKNHTLAGAFILSYSRYFMYHFIHRYNVVYTDTDSLHIPISDYEDMKKNYPWLVIKGKKNLGQVENEFVDKGVAKENICHYIGKKMYCICDKDNKPVKTICKGVSIRDVERFGYYDNEGNLKRFSNKNILEYYMILMNKGHCDITTVQWTKKNILKEKNKKDKTMGCILIRDMKKSITCKNYRKYILLSKVTNMGEYDKTLNYPTLKTYFTN